MKNLKLFSAIICLFALMSFTTDRFSLLNAKGKITMLRVHDVGTKYGPPTDQIDVEVVIHLDTEPGKAFGFQLRDDSKKIAREGMLNLLRDAFQNNWPVSIDYNIDPGKKNGVIIRTWISK